MLQLGSSLILLKHLCNRLDNLVVVPLAAENRTVRGGRARTGQLLNNLHLCIVTRSNDVDLTGIHITDSFLGDC